MNKNQDLSGLDSRKSKFERRQLPKLNALPFGVGKCIVVYHIQYIYSFVLLLAEIELVPQRCNIQILRGLEESGWLVIKTDERRMNIWWSF